MRFALAHIHSEITMGRVLLHVEGDGRSVGSLPEIRLSEHIVDLATLVVNATPVTQPL